MAIWEFDTQSTEDLEKAVELYDQLEEIGLCFVNEDAIQAIKSELESREE